MKFTIVVYFDTVCPWCYIGDRILSQAIQLFQRTYPGASKDDFDFEYRPFYLNTNAPVQGVPMEEAITRKNGVDKLDAIKSRLKRVGAASGIAFSFDGKIGSTRASHALVWRAGKEKGGQMQKALVEGLLSLVFEHGGDVTSPDDLVKAAIGAGLEESVAREWMAEEEAGNAVDELAKRAREEGVTSVPTYEVAKMRLEGAEDATAFYGLFAKVREAEGDGLVSDD